MGIYGSPKKTERTISGALLKGREFYGDLGRYQCCRVCDFKRNFDFVFKILNSGLAKCWNL